MKEQEKKCGTQPAHSQETSSHTSRVTFSMEKKVLTAEQYRDWQLIAACLRKKENGERS